MLLLLLLDCGLRLLLKIVLIDVFELVEIDAAAAVGFSSRVDRHSDAVRIRTEVEAIADNYMIVIRTN